MGKDQSADEAAYDLQRSIVSWGRLLMAYGGSLKPEKCFFYLISFVWKQDGKWSYDANELNEEFNMGVPMPALGWHGQRNVGSFHLPFRMLRHSSLKHE